MKITSHIFKCFCYVPPPPPPWGIQKFSVSWPKMSVPLYAVIVYLVEVGDVCVFEKGDHWEVWHILVCLL